MLRIGYVRLRDAQSADETAALKALGCHVVRAEEPAAMFAGEETATLDSILDFIGAGDQLVISRLAQLGPSSRCALDVLDRLEQRGASLRILDPELSTEGPGGHALRAALEAVAALEPAGVVRRRRPDAQEILQLQRAGVGPVEIARRLGVSRMTVWRKLKSFENALA
ncbi:recombinase family protein [Phenylobacterium deserti]|nr:recombinase family protein [Phenylobacterium deserti]